MELYITELSKYFITLFIACYTLECFLVFRFQEEERCKAGYFRQNIWMFLVHFSCFLVICFETGKIEYLLFYVLQQILLFSFVMLFRMIYPKGNLLIISPPRAGKTTLLRDLLRQISNSPMESVGIVDERSEIAACYRGRPQNDVGERSDVLDGCPKAQGMLMLLRSMSPTVIGVDELGRREDIDAVLRITNCGVKVIATVHGDNLEEVRKKEVFQELFRDKIFRNYIILEREEIKRYNREFQQINSGQREEAQTC